jgi:SWI/SNF-related matrix-associated actin-dependent regulator of chromatin subfamily A-like protein 1
MCEKELVDENEWALIDAMMANTTSKLSTPTATSIHRMKLPSVEKRRKQASVFTSAPYKRFNQLSFGSSSSSSQSSSSSSHSSSSSSSYSNAQITLEAHSSSRFGAKRVPFSLKNAVNSVPDSLYDHNAKMWTWPYARYADVKAAARAAQPNVRIFELPESVFDVFVARRWLARHQGAPIDWARLPDALSGALKPHQRRGVEFAVSRRGRMLFADEMGVGKTLQAITVAAYYRDEWPLLVIAPSSVRENWRGELMRWLGDERTALVDESDVVVVRDGKANCRQHRIVITSVDLAARPTIVAQLRAQRFRVAIVDESHTLKNAKSKRAETLVPLLRDVPHLMLLSGTPALSRPIELFTQLNMLDASLFRQRHAFGLRYCDAKEERFRRGVWNYKGSSHLGELHLLLSSTVMIRRLKNDVLRQLPDKRRERVLVSIGAEHHDIIKATLSGVRQLRSSLHSRDGETRRAARSEQLGAIMRLYSTTGVAKIPATAAHVVELLEREPTAAVLVFAHHQDVLNGVEHVLNKRALDSIRIDGQVNARHRQQLVDYFQTTPTCRVALLSITAAGCGITLTKANYVIFAELHWNPGSLRQAEDRAHRIGQQRDVNVHFLVAKDSVDTALWDMVAKKLHVLGSALDGGADQFGVEQSATSAVGDSQMRSDIVHDGYLKEIMDSIFAVKCDYVDDGSGGSEDGQANKFVHPAELARQQKQCRMEHQNEQQHRNEIDLTMVDDQTMDDDAILECIDDGQSMQQKVLQSFIQQQQQVPQSFICSPVQQQQERQVPQPFIRSPIQQQQQQERQVPQPFIRSPVQQQQEQERQVPQPFIRSPVQQQQVPQPFIRSPIQQQQQQERQVPQPFIRSPVQQQQVPQPFIRSPIQQQQQQERQVPQPFIRSPVQQQQVPQPFVRSPIQQQQGGKSVQVQQQRRQVAQPFVRAATQHKQQQQQQVLRPFVQNDRPIQKQNGLARLSHFAGLPKATTCKRRSLVD